MGIWTYASVIIAKFAMKITPYKRLSAVIMTVLIVLISILHIILFWKIGDYSQTKIFIILLLSSAAILYIGFGFIGGLFLGEEDKNE